MGESSEESSEEMTKEVKSSEETVRNDQGSEGSSTKILGFLKVEPNLTAEDLGQRIGITSRAVEKQIAKLKEEGRLRRIGSTKAGYWEVSPQE